MPNDGPDVNHNGTQSRAWSRKLFPGVSEPCFQALSTIRVTFLNVFLRVSQCRVISRVVRVSAMGSRFLNSFFRLDAYLIRQQESDGVGAVIERSHTVKKADLR
jgi:hypothetical protein